MRQAPNISGHDVQFVFIEEVIPRRHLVVAAVGNGFDNGFLRAAPQPNVIGQIRPQAQHALAFVTVTGKAVGRRAVEDGIAAGGTLFQGIAPLRRLI